MLVVISGPPGTGDNPDGWLTFYINNENHDIGVVHEESYGFSKEKYDFRPHLDSNKFNLDESNGRFYMKTMVNDYTISWE